ncbi:hypothetical protein [Bifidobacterium margollesii]|uniref:hypothetical protein n=1 Tax=Bifidobacterium margollesii TaxID=2020964 RepID=UPI0013FE3188|nr:hypothetical protein [Bifidobacterium margollesii]
MNHVMERRPRCGALDVCEYAFAPRALTTHASHDPRHPTPGSPPGGELSPEGD